METIVNEIAEILKSESHFIAKEKALVIYLANLIREIITMAFEQIDDDLIGEYKKQGYQIEKKNDRKLLTVFGEIQFRRRRYIKEGESSVYALDVFLGLKSHDRYSHLLKRNVAELASKMTYRNSEKAIELLTSFTMSHRKINRLVLQVGEEIKSQQTAEERYDERKDKKRRPSAIYIEGDGIQIKGQKKNQLEIYRFQVCEGSRPVGKNRRQLKNYHEFVSLSRKQALKETQEYLANTYRLEKTIVISNSDGGSGFEKNVFEELAGNCRRHEFFLDAYHVNRKIKERLSNFKDLQPYLMEAIWQAYSWDKVVVALDTAASLLVDEQDTEKNRESLRLLENYLTRNWKWLQPFEQRNLAGIQKCIGTCESNHRVYSYRMKRQGRYWTKSGAEAMVRVISSIKNKEIEQCLMTDYAPAEPEDALKKRCQQALRNTTSKRWNRFEEHVGIQYGHVTGKEKTSTGMGKLIRGLCS
ncbi:hypothetical protein IGI37_002806 [Enterococcus sp. AZ194]|uniref:ISLre2 family transposase n=1 Tax=Enterococcus sp. AZ194 TaxID=2774629 RepID=UPI003F1FF060